MPPCPEGVWPNSMSKPTIQYITAKYNQEPIWRITFTFIDVWKKNRKRWNSREEKKCTYEEKYNKNTIYIAISKSQPRSYCYKMLTIPLILFWILFSQFFGAVCKINSDLDIVSLGKKIILTVVFVVPDPSVPSNSPARCNWKMQKKNLKEFLKIGLKFNKTK